MSIRWPATELDATTFPAWREALEAYDGSAPASGGAADAPDHTPRAYPGYRRWPLPRTRSRWRSSLDRALTRRRSARGFDRAQPTPAELGRLCGLAHGVCGEAGRGPVPSAGGLQALELYLVVRAPGWLPLGAYHYDRAGHALSTIVERAFDDLVPALITVDDPPLIWLIAGDGARVADKYGARGLRFLLLEAGHLMQNLCLVAADLGLSTVPLGGFFERPLADALQLPPSDELLYAGACGRPA